MKIKIMLICLLAIAVLLWSGVAYAQPTGYSLTWWTVDGGGGDISGTGYTLSSTIGQPDAGTLTGSGYILTGGYWGGGQIQAGQNTVYLPIVRR